MKVEIEGVELSLQRRHNGEHRVCWCSDWAKLSELVDEHPALSLKTYGPGTYGHTDVMVDVEEQR